MSKLPFLLLAGILSLLASACRTGGVSPEDALSWSYWMVDEHKAGTSGARLVFHQPSASKPLVWVWGRPLASQPP